MDPLADSQLERTARRRAGAKMGWLVHASTYIAVNIVLATASALSGKHWAIFPALGWGMGLLVHGIIVFMVTGGGGVFDRLIERERNQLRAQQERW
jgi:hypothetical protein